MTTQHYHSTVTKTGGCCTLLTSDLHYAYAVRLPRQPGPTLPCSQPEGMLQVPGD